MKFLSGAFRALKDRMTADTVLELEAPANNGLNSVLLTVKKKGSGEHYVVLARGRDDGEGGGWGVAFTKDDWEQFSALADAIQDYLAQHSLKSKK